MSVEISTARKLTVKHGDRESKRCVFLTPRSNFRCHHFIAKDTEAGQPESQVTGWYSAEPCLWSRLDSEAHALCAIKLFGVFSLLYVRNTQCMIFTMTSWSLLAKCCCSDKRTVPHHAMSHVGHTSTCFVCKLEGWLKRAQALESDWLGLHTYSPTRWCINMGKVTSMGLSFPTCSVSTVL